MTNAGSGVGGFNLFYEVAEKMSPLGNASADECADYCVMMFSDYPKKVTMQTLFPDGGFSTIGMSAEAIQRFSPTCHKAQ